ncbi:MAG: phytanoyl-CoA dioxygenase [Phycisphaeraceae bacterium]|nr:phytanoyl-CoA dioxygenase [Phycisphaeraceae bacterium]
MSSAPSHDGDPAFAHAMKALGASPGLIGPDHRSALEEHGFTIFREVIDPNWLTSLRDAFERIHREEGERAGIEVMQLPGVRRLADLVNKTPAVDGMWQHPMVLAAAHFLIGRPLKLHSVNAHDPRPGHGAQRLHRDTKVPREDMRTCNVVNTMWMLDDVTRDNGATRVVPATHVLPEDPKAALDDPEAAHPDEVYLTGPAGTVAMFHGDLWHSCTTNRSARSRRICHCAFIGRELPQQTDQRAHLRPETARRLSPAARFILDA